jgi:hypothetical protein
MYPCDPDPWVAMADPMYSTQRPRPADLHPVKSFGFAVAVVWAKHAHWVMFSSQSSPHSCTVSSQLSKTFHALLALASRQ